MSANKGGRPRKQLDVDVVTTAYAAGTSMTSLARELGVSRGVVRRVLVEAGVTLRDDRGGHWASRRGRALLDEVRAEAWERAHDSLCYLQHLGGDCGHESPYRVAP